MSINRESLLNRSLSRMYSKHLVSPRNLELALAQRGISVLTAQLVEEDVCFFDQDHFGGVRATSYCMNQTNMDKGSRVFDAGSGLGGPARFFAANRSARVFGVEVQPDRYQSSVNLTKLTGLDKYVSFELGDMSQAEIPIESFTHFVSFLSILHLKEKAAFLKKIGSLLVHNGWVYIEDYYSPGKLSGKEKTSLLNTISCPSLLTKHDYLNVLMSGGVQIIKCVDMTRYWKKLVHSRYEVTLLNRDVLNRIYGKSTTDGAIEFAKGVKRIFDMCVVCGFRLIGRRF